MYPASVKISRYSQSVATNPSSGVGASSLAKDVSNHPSMRTQAIERTLCRFSASIFFVALFVLLLSTNVSAEAEDPTSQYQILQWKDRVVQGWEHPLLLSEEEGTTAPLPTSRCRVHSSVSFSNFEV